MKYASEWAKSNISKNDCRQVLFGGVNKKAILIDRFFVQILTQLLFNSRYYFSNPNQSFPEIDAKNP